MRKLLLLALLVTLVGCKEEDPLAAHLGAYYGGFDTSMTLDPRDDLNPNECLGSTAAQGCENAHGNPLSHLLMRLDLNTQGQLTLAFYRTESDYTADNPMYLSPGCRLSIGPATDYQLHELDRRRDETQLLASASFPLIFGNTMPACTDSSRFNTTSVPTLELALQLNPVTSATAVGVTLEKSRRDGNYLYVKQGGKKIPVELDLSYTGSNGSETHRVCGADGETALENADGFRSVCIVTGRKKWSVVLPISPFGPGVTAFWGSTRSPKWYRTSNQPDIVGYHRGLFLPVKLDAPEQVAPAELPDQDSALE